MTEIPVDKDATIEVIVESSRPDIEQSLHIRARRAELEVVEHVALDDDDDDYTFDPSIISDNLTIVANQPRRIEFVLAAEDSEQSKSKKAKNSTKPAVLQLWNSWLLGDAEHAWTGNSGIVIEELDPPSEAKSQVRLWCSDGLGDPQFDDLVVLVTVG